MANKKALPIRVYEYDTTSFNNNGICTLFPTNAVIRRSLNDFEYALDITHPIDDFGKWKEIVEDRIIKANNQLFRIKYITKTMNNITAYCEHIFFDLQQNFIEDTNIVNKNGMLAINQILSHTVYSHPFSGTSDISITNNSRMVRKNVLTALIGDDDNSFINRWGSEGAELDIDNFNFKINKRIGSDNGYKIEYGKNLTGVSAKFDMTNVVTVVRPVGFDGIELPENDKYIYSPYVDNYAVPIIREYKYEDVKWKGSPNYEAPEDGEDDGAYETLEEAQTELRRLAELEFTDNKIDVPSVTYDINFIELSNTEEYQDYIIVAQIGIGDDVTIRHKLLGIDIPARCISYEYDCLTCNYNEITLGHYNTNFFSDVKKVISNTEEINKTIQQLPDKMNEMLMQAKQYATEYVNGGWGGYIYYTPNGLYILDNQDINLAKNVAVLNMNGLAFGNNGINGTFETGITRDGHIVADFIDTGILNAGIVKSGILESLNGETWINMEDGSFSFANGSLNYNGNNLSLETNTDMNERTIIDAYGVEIQKKGNTLASFRGEKSYIPYLYTDDIQCSKIVTKGYYNNIYYVNGNNGNDMSDGKTPQTAFSTVQKAIDELPDLMAYDVNIYVSGNVPSFSLSNKSGNGLINIILNEGTNVKGDVIISGGSNPIKISTNSSSNSEEIVVLSQGIKQDGTLDGIESFTRIDTYIPVSNTSTIETGVTGYARFIYYDDKKNYIGYHDVQGMYATYKIQDYAYKVANASYIRFSINQPTTIVLVNDKTNKNSYISGQLIVKGTRNFELEGVLFNNNDNTDNASILLERNTMITIERCEFLNNKTYCISNTRGTLMAKDIIGNSVPYVIDINEYSIIHLFNGKVPNYTNGIYSDNSNGTAVINIGDNLIKTDSDTSSSDIPSYSESAKQQVWECYDYYSHEDYLWGFTHKGSLRQGFSHGIGRWKGYINFDYQKIREVINGAKNISAQIYMHRSYLSKEYSGETKMGLYASDGTVIDITTKLKRDEGKWIDIPSEVIQKIIDGTVTHFYVTWNVMDIKCFIYYDTVCKIKINYSK